MAERADDFMLDYNTRVKRRGVARWAALKTERSSYDSHYQILAKNVLPRSSRFVTTDRNQRGGQQHNSIIDSTATRALRTLGAGMMSGMTSPARPWFTLRTPDPELNKNVSVREWLQTVTDLMLRIFSKSNTYNALHSIYRELGLYGTAANFVSSDFDSVIHNYTATVGEYALATDNRMIVDTIYRELEITIDQAVGWFGENALTPQRQVAYASGKGDQTMDILHIVEPRRDRDPSKRDNRNMPFRSLYIETAGAENAILQEGGFRQFPAMCPRWDVTSNDTYGSSPGMEALGDILQLQQEQFDKAKAIAYKANPPLQVPTSMRERDADLLPGGISYYDGSGPGSGIRTAFEVNLEIDHLMQDIADVRQRINAAFYADIFLMLANSTDSNMTATEVAERHEEKLLMLGPVLERLHKELLQPLIDATFARIMETGIAPPPPEELHGMDIQIEFVSILAQAQRAIGVNATDRFVANLGSIAAIKPNILDRFNEDGWVEHYSDVLGVDASLVVPMEKALFIREQRAKAQAAQEQLAAANAAADTAQKGAAAAVDAQQAGIALPTGAGYGIGMPTPAQGSSLPQPLAPGAGY
jgi:hypothetical protein